MNAIAQMPANKNLTYLACGLVIWPYALVPNIVNAGLLAIAAAWILLQSDILSNFKSKAYLGILALIVAHIVLDVTTVNNKETYFSHINNYIQFLYLFPAFSILMGKVDFRNIIRNNYILSINLIWILVYEIIERSIYQSPAFSDFTINSLIICAGLISRNKEDKIRLYWQFIGAFLIMIFAYSRSGPMFISVAFLVFYHFNISNKITKISATLLIALPIVVYLTLSDHAMVQLKNFDFNSYIRAEFIRGALPTFLQSPIFGSGFDVPYRDIRFSGYLDDHPLLRLNFRADFVSNHHSLFDIALRIGLAGAGLFYYLAVVRPPLFRSEQWKSFLLVALAQGFGMNAWFENQNQLLQAILILSVLNVELKRSKRIDAQERDLMPMLRASNYLESR